MRERKAKFVRISAHNLQREKTRIELNRRTSTSFLCESISLYERNASVFFSFRWLDGRAGITVSVQWVFSPLATTSSDADTSMLECVFPFVRRRSFFVAQMENPRKKWMKIEDTQLQPTISILPLFCAITNTATCRPLNGSAQHVFEALLLNAGCVHEWDCCVCQKLFCLVLVFRFSSSRTFGDVMSFARLDTQRRVHYACVSQWNCVYVPDSS